MVAMKSSHVKASVASYFRYKRQFPLVSFERPISSYISNPDVFVMDKKRMLIEIEVKVTMADFKKDCLKRIWVYREEMPNRHPMPYQFYYAVPDKLREKAIEVINGWKAEGKKCGNVGLLTVKPCENIKFLCYNDVFVAKTAPRNMDSKRLSLKDVTKMVINQSATLCSCAKQVAKMEMDKPPKPKKPRKRRKTRKRKKLK